MCDYANDIDRIWWYTQFLAKRAGHSGKDNVLDGTLVESIETIREYIRELAVKYYMIPDDENDTFHEILDFDDTVGSYKSHIACLANCLGRLSLYSNVPANVMNSFFREDISAQMLEMKYGNMVM